MSIPRGDCDCCGIEANSLLEIEEGYFVCRPCRPTVHLCPDGAHLVTITRTERFDYE